MILKRAPRWWPHEGRRVAAVGVLRGGIGWLKGDGDLLSEREVEEAREVMKYEWPGAEFTEKEETDAKTEVRTTARKGRKDHG
jgi:hypothetical protein